MKYDWIKTFDHVWQMTLHLEDHPKTQSNLKSFIAFLISVERGKAQEAVGKAILEKELGSDYDQIVHGI